MIVLGFAPAAWLTFLVVIVVTITLARESWGPDLVMFGGLCVLVASGVLTPRQALVGFSEPAVATIAVLLIVAGAVQSTGALRLVSSTILGSSSNPLVVLLRLVVPTAFMSAFLNNTPIVAMFIPIVRSYGEKMGINPSKLLIPLSYATMFGGMCTVMGTSANLVISGQLEQGGYPALGVMEIGWVGIPLALIGIAYLAIIGQRLLPDREDPLSQATNQAKEYLAELEIMQDSPLIGRTVEQAGLRSLRGLYLVELRRQDQKTVVRPVAPTTILQAGDSLVLTGLSETLEDVISDFPGLSAHEDVQVDNARLFEVVISHRSWLVNETPVSSQFRRRFDAAILAIHRSGARISDRKLGEVVLEAGDTLMLSASEGFRRSWQNSEAFYLVSDRRERPPATYRQANLVIATTIAVVLVPAFFNVPLLVPAMGALVFLMATNCLDLRTVRRSINWPILVLIGSAFGIARALDVTGAASGIAQILINTTEPFGPRATLAAIYIIGVLMASFISNAASAALVFPVAMEAAVLGGHDPRPFAVALALAASAGFSTPIGCAPNLLVYGPGGYRYLDFTKVGLPLTLLFMAVTLYLVPIVWPF